MHFLGMNAQLCCGEEPVCDWGEERSIPWHLLLTRIPKDPGLLREGEASDCKGVQKAART